MGNSPWHSKEAISYQQQPAYGQQSAYQQSNQQPTYQQQPQGNNNNPSLNSQCPEGDFEYLFDSIIFQFAAQVEPVAKIMRVIRTEFVVYNIDHALHNLRKER